jgi:hypothetical protein
MHKKVFLNTESKRKGETPVRSITASLVQSNTTFVVLFIIYYSTGDRFRSITTGRPLPKLKPGRSVKFSSVITSERRINCRYLSAAVSGRACRNSRTLTALVCTRLPEFEKPDAC